MRRALQPTCVCKVVGSPCLHVAGSGTIEHDPYVAHAKIDPDVTNRLQKSTSGLKILLPSEVTHRPAVRVEGVNEQTFDGIEPVLVSFDLVLYDSGGMWDSGNSGTIVIPRDGFYSIGCGVTGDGDEVYFATVMVMVNGRRLMYEGPRRRDVAGLGIPSVMQTQDLFEAGDRCEVWYQPIGTLPDNTSIHSTRYFYATYRGEAA